MLNKYYLGVTTITQDVEDFVRSLTGNLLQTPPCSFCKQSPSKVEPLSKIFNLTEGEQYLFEFGEWGKGSFLPASSMWPFRSLLPMVKISW